MNSVTDFLMMNGHGFYVWCAYGMMVFLLVLESVLLARRRAAAVARAKKEARRAETYE